MKILIAPDKFKGTLTAPQVAATIARALQRKFPEAEIIQQPLADGGEGSLDLIAATVPGLQPHRLEVTGPLRKPVKAEYLYGNGRAFIETAEACGLKHVPVPRRDPRYTTTIGVGQLIDDAIARGATEITLFLGGSATNDCGAGMAAALGYRFFSNRPDDFVPTGESLKYVQRIDTAEVPAQLKNIRFTAVCDVDNPLLGPQGATLVYAAQKGAKPEDLAYLEANMARFSDTVLAWNGVRLHDLPGAGAAGGLSAGAVAFLNADLRPGIDVIMEAVGFEALLKNVDLVVTGEGKVDEQTPHGKVVSGVARRAKAAGVPRVIALCGRNELSGEAARAMGLSDVHALLDLSSMTLARALYRTENALEELVGLRF